MDSARVLLFVYGTLMRGEWAHGLLSGSSFVGEATTAPGHALLDLGSYPGMVREGDGAVRGELFTIEAALVPKLDEYEGAPELFERAVVELADGTKALSYLFRAGASAATARIPDGNWRSRRA